MATTTKARPAADWSLAPRGPVSGAVTGFLGLAALAATAHAIEVGPVWTAAGTVVSAVGSILHSADRGAHTPTLLYRLCCVLGGGGWVAYAAATTPWDQTTMLGLGLGVLAAAVTTPWFRVKGPDATRGGGRGSGTLVLRKTAALAQEWERRILDVARIRFQVTQVENWENGCGYSLHGVMFDGATRKQLASNEDALASSAQLPDGCGVEVKRGGRRSHVVLDVSTVNRLTEDVGWEPEHKMTSMMEPKKLGEFRDGSPVLVQMRQASAFVTGQRGSGKTTTLHGMTWRAVMCNDGLGYHLDLNGGSLSQPWLDPWINGQSNRPAIDWAASDLNEGLALVSWLLDVAKDRKRTYRHLKIAAGTSLMPIGTGAPGQGPPAMTLFVDEGAEALSPSLRDPAKRELRDGIEELQRIGRDGAVNVVASALRATQDTVAPNIVKQSTIRIGMFVMDETELNYLYGWNASISADDLYGPGTGFIQTAVQGVRPWKSGNLFPEGIQPGDPRHNMIGKAAVFVANHRPDADAAAVAVGGDIYRGRLDRMREAFGVDSVGVALPTDMVQAPAPSSPTPTPGATTATRRSHLSVVDSAAAWPDPADIAAAAAAKGSLFSRSYDLTPARTETIHAEQVLAVEGRPLPELLTRALSMPWDDGRLHSAVLAGHLGMTEHDLARLLGALGVTALRNAFLRGGNRGRGYEQADLEDAAEAIRRGELDVPPEVADWPAA